MKVTIKNHIALDIIKEKQTTIEVNLQTGSNISDMLKLLDLDESLVGIILINDELSEKNNILKDGDFVVVFPLIFGG